MPWVIIPWNKTGTEYCAGACPTYVIVNYGRAVCGSRLVICRAAFKNSQLSLKAYAEKMLEESERLLPNETEELLLA